jgi:SAM-dependent methyltransferase
VTPSRSTLRFPSPSDDLEWTGERFVLGLTGQAAFEHFHRYLFGTQFCDGRAVLDIACGEGYGSYLLAQVATKVLGVDNDEATIRHAKRKYETEQLNFAVGTCTNIPAEDHSVDVVVSFETLEHINEQNDFLKEVGRVLRPPGLLIMSTPDRTVYSPGQTNPFHLRELSKPEFSQLLNSHFDHVQVGLQKAVAGSAIFPEQDRGSSLQVFGRLDSCTFALAETLSPAPFLVAVASNSVLPEIRWGVLEDSFYLSGFAAANSAALLEAHAEACRYVRSLQDVLEERTKSEKSAEQYARSLEQALVELRASHNTATEYAVSLERSRAEIEAYAKHLESEYRKVIERR